MHQDASGCMDLTQHTSAYILIPLLQQCSFCGSMWRCFRLEHGTLQKGTLSRQPRKQGATMCCGVSRQGVQVQSETLRWKAECGPLLTRLGEVTTAVVSGAGLGGKRYMELLNLQVYLCRRSRISRFRMTIRSLSLAVLQERT